MVIWKGNVKNKILFLIFVAYFFVFVKISNGQLIKLDGQKINTNYILYVLKGLFIFGENESPYVLLGKKKDMDFKAAHAIFENVGISTTDNKNTKYFSFEMGDTTSDDNNNNENNINENNKKNSNDDNNNNNNNNKKNSNDDNNNSNDNKNDDNNNNNNNNDDNNNNNSYDNNTKELQKSYNNHSNNTNSPSDKQNDDDENKDKFKINLYKDNPYLRKKKEYRYSEDVDSFVTPELFLELIIMKEKDFNKHYLPKDHDICCYMQEEGIDGYEKYTCPGKGYLKRYIDEDSIYSLKLPVYFINDRIKDDNDSNSNSSSNSSSSSSGSSYYNNVYNFNSGNEMNHENLLNHLKNKFVYNIKDTDVYALFLSNCMDSKKYELHLHGNIHILNEYGYLPGDKISKLNLYVLSMIIYSIYLFIWSYLLIKNKNYVIKIQIWILVCVFLYLMENVFLFLYFLSYNLYAKVNNELLFISVCSSILKNVCSYLLILLGSLGWGIVIPTLDRKTFIKIKILFFFFIIFDFIKQFVDMHLTDTQINTGYFLFCIIPVTIIYSIIYLWVFTSASQIIIQLNEDKQYEKLNMFKNFFNVLIFTLLFSIIAFIIDIVVMIYVDNSIWNLKNYLSEGIISCLFLIILTAMFILFKPSDRLKRISHFTEIGDMDEMEDFSNFKNSIEDIS
ncbi:serpentine receptor, putative [Plasmodium sp. DRC-Itaito]|nr:serpentine receptor, putative [Plasmodium sp. DRC-Itaito]